MSTITESIVTRLAACFREITPIVTAYEGPPSMPIEDANLPTAVVMVGAMSEGRPLRAGHVNLVRSFPVRVFIAPIEQGTDAAYLGDSKYETGLGILDRAYVYFDNHKRLSTTGLGALSSVTGIQLKDTGITGRVGPGGAQYWTIEFTVTIETTIQYCNTFS